MRCRVRSDLRDLVEHAPYVVIEGTPAEPPSPERTHRLGEKRFSEVAPISVLPRPLLQNADVSLAQTLN